MNKLLNLFGFLLLCQILVGCDWADILSYEVETYQVVGNPPTLLDDKKKDNNDYPNYYVGKARVRLIILPDRDVDKSQKEGIYKTGPYKMLLAIEQLGDNYKTCSIDSISISSSKGMNHEILDEENIPIILKFEPLMVASGRDTHIYECNYRFKKLLNLDFKGSEVITVILKLQVIKNERNKESKILSLKAIPVLEKRRDGV